MIEVISNTEPKARKDYYCMSCEWILNAGISEFGFSFSELRVLVRAKRNGWKIKKGERYLNQRNKQDGTLYTFRSIPEIHQICIDHDVYQD